MYSAFSYGSNTLSSITGASVLVSTRRREALDTTLESHLLQQLRIMQLVHSLHERRPFPRNIAVTAIPSRSPYLDSLLELAFRVPPYLEIIDLAASPGPQDMHHDLPNCLIALENALLAWLKDFRTSHHCSNGNQVITDNIDEDPLAGVLGKSFFSLTCETLCWMCLLLIGECHVRLGSSSLRSQSGIISESYAAILRKTTVALADAASSPACKARAVRGPLHFLKRHYTSCGDEDGLRWCMQMKADVCGKAPYLCWDGLLPHTFLSLHCMPG